jgi:hypothetical protein
MASTQAVPPIYVSAAQPGTNTASSVELYPQHLDLLHPNVLDGAYYVAVLRNYLQLANPPGAVPTSDKFEWRDIECLSFSAGSSTWETDWRSPSSDTARLFILRGHISPELLKDLTRTFRLSPAFLVGHAGSDLSPRTLWPICPPLPSQRSNMGHVRFLTLGQGYIRKCYNRTTGIQPEGRFDFSGMPALREKYRRNTERLNFGPMSNRQVGDTGVRDVHFHDRRYFSVEQVVSFCFVRDGQKDSWVGKSASE